MSTFSKVFLTILALVVASFFKALPCSSEQWLLYGRNQMKKNNRNEIINQ